jgi:hypothetical protein
VVEAERVDIEAELRNLRRNRAEPVGERLGLGIRVHEQERPPALEPHGLQADAFDVEVRARRRAQAPVEAVRPRVVGTLQRPPVAHALGDRRAAVPADIGEGARAAVLGA